MLFQAGANDGFGVGDIARMGSRREPSRRQTLLRYGPTCANSRTTGSSARTDEAERQRIAKRYDKTLAAAEALLDQYAFMTLKTTEHSLNSSSLAVPLELPGPVVLDATAGVDLMYELMEDRADIIPTPRGVRDYHNVTVHVARTERIGKTAMEELAAPTLSCTARRTSPSV